ncbi:hypothetical protein BJP25_02355 [Actinokineospora bangkokensis]|uniref:Uncharacterized protein n=1 Tax=Actinokineospora bangkokensis TaxID=1193682 RepID=A0A1Q9LCY0_9PSEU|nr:hypothetical protein BJP25_02355 [Actinokineospora bangkokensis]
MVAAGRFAPVVPVVAVAGLLAPRGRLPVAVRALVAGVGAAVVAVVARRPVAQGPAVEVAVGLVLRLVGLLQRAGRPAARRGWRLGARALGPAHRAAPGRARGFRLGGGLGGRLRLRGEAPPALAAAPAVGGVVV